MPIFNQTSSLKGKKVLVTGAGRGIGRAVCVEFYKQGATVFAVSRNPDNLKSLKDECPDIKTIAVDLSDWSKTKVVLELEVDYVDALINNAGLCIPGQLQDITSDSFDQQFNLNVKAVVNVSQVISKKMIARGKGGAIVNISSVGGRRAYPPNTAYSCSKAALEMLTKCMAAELGPHKITVNSISPAAVDTDMLRSTTSKGSEKNPTVDPELIKRAMSMIPTRTFYMPMNEVVSIIAFLASGVTTQITGESIAVDGGVVNSA